MKTITKNASLIIFILLSAYELYQMAINNSYRTENKAIEIMTCSFFLGVFTYMLISELINKK